MRSQLYDLALLYAFSLGWAVSDERFELASICVLLLRRVVLSRARSLREDEATLHMSCQWKVLNGASLQIHVFVTRPRCTPRTSTQPLSLSFAHSLTSPLLLLAACMQPASDGLDLAREINANSNDLWAVLGLPPGSGPQDLRRAYILRSKLIHPE